jgi:biotin synthase
MGCIKQEGLKTSRRGGDGKDFNPFEAMQPRLPAKTPKDRRNGAYVKQNDLAPRGVYRPDYNILTPHMRSPEYVQMSTAAAITLGVTGGRMPQPAADLPRGLPGELRILRPGAPP